MSSIQQDLSIFNKFNFDRPPVGVKFLATKPDGIERLDKVLALCEMLREAQERSPFYATKEDFECVGPLLFGMVEPDLVFESGLVGPKLGIFKEARANKRIYQYIPRMTKGTVNYVAFSPLDKLPFDPDVLVVTANPSQAEIILRASSYTTGKMWFGRGTPVMGCTWIFIYPYLSGELNFTISGIFSGMKARNVLPDGLVLISIPWDLLTGIVENLQDMEWVLPEYTETRDEHNETFKRIAEALEQEFQKK
ncbi:MAG: DUF169 domain-containing protein [Chloroflexi bacterium]|nr:DUF169 domain-containing protein [Chloroflexota bacterium]MBL7061506.1 DUF169 domain-containing protein [Dehalococcoidia bacterium]